MIYTTNFTEMMLTFITPCVIDYRKFHPLAGVIKRTDEYHSSAYLCPLEELADELVSRYVCPPESYESKNKYNPLIEKAIAEKNPSKESLIKCARYMERLCTIAISLNEYIYSESETIYEVLDSWCKIHEIPLKQETYRTLYHLYVFIPIFVVRVQDNKEIENILTDLKLNADRSPFDYCGPHTDIWSEYKAEYPNYLISPDMLLGTDLHIPDLNKSKNKEEVDKIMREMFPEKGLITIIDDYAFSRVTSVHPLDVMIDSLRHECDQTPVIYV